MRGVEVNAQSHESEEATFRSLLAILPWPKVIPGPPRAHLSVISALNTTRFLLTTRNIR